MSKAVKGAVGGKKKVAGRGVLSTKTIFRTCIKSGSASAAPPLGPLLGKFGLNISNFCKEFNEKTKSYKKGIPLPVTVKINPNRSYDINLQTPSLRYYLLQAAGIDKPKVKEETKSGEITLKHIYEIAKIKHEDPHSRDQIRDLEEVVREAVGLTKLLGLEIVKEIDPVQYKDFLEKRNKFLEELAEEEEKKQKLKLQRL